MDKALDLVARRAAVAAQAQLATYSKRLHTKAGMATSVAVDWNSFATHPCYADLDVPAQRNACSRIVKMATSVVGFEKADKGLLGIVLSKQKLKHLPKLAVRVAAKSHVRCILVSYHADGRPTFDASLSDEGVLCCSVAFDARKKECWAFVGPLCTLLGNRAMRDATAARMVKAASTVGTGKRLTFAADWDAFLEQATLGTMSDDEQRRHIGGLGDHAAHVGETMRVAGEHSITKTSLASLQRVTLRVGTGSLPVTYSITDGGSTLEVAVSTQGMVAPAHPARLLTGVRLRSLLGCHVAYERATAEAHFGRHSAACRSGCELGSSFNMSLDWSIFEAPWFAALSPEEQAGALAQLKDKLARRLVEDMCTVCEHPIGAKCLRERVEAVRICCERLPDGPATAVDVDGSTIVVRVDEARLAAAAQGRFKEAIEFAYDLVVAIAADNAAGLHSSLEQSLTQAMQQHDASLPGVSLGIALEFAHTDAFRALPPSEQADIVTVLHRLPPLIGARSGKDEGLLGALRHHTAATRLTERFGDCCLEVAVDEHNGVAAPGGWECSGGKLCFRVSMSHVLALDGATDWCAPRVLGAIDTDIRQTRVC